MKKKPIVSALIGIIIVICIFIPVARFTSSTFRYAYDVNFNQINQHVTYSEDKKTELELPSQTCFAWRESDTHVIYYSKLSINSFINFYKNNNYLVSDNIVLGADGNKYLIKNIDNTLKYHLIEIYLISEEK